MAAAEALFAQESLRAKYCAATEADADRITADIYRVWTHRIQQSIINDLWPEPNPPELTSASSVRLDCRQWGFETLSPCQACALYTFEQCIQSECKLSEHIWIPLGSLSPDLMPCRLVWSMQQLLQ